MNVDRHDYEMLLVNMLGLKKLSSNPDAGSASGICDLYVGSDNSLHYKDINGTDHVLPMGVVGAVGTALLALGNASGGFRMLTSVGHNGAGAATLTGAKVGDVVLGISNVTDHATLLPTTDFEAAITVNDQIQQVSASDLSLKTIVVLLAAKS